MQITKGEDIDFYYITEPEDVEPVAKRLDQQSIFATDTEVEALHDQYGEKASWRDPHTSRVRLLQVAGEHDEIPYVLDVKKLGVENCRPVIDVLANPEKKKVGHAFKYDLKVIKSTFDVWLPNSDCTMILMQRLGLCTGYKAAQIRGFSLKALARDYFDITLSKVEQDSDWSTPILRSSQLEYAALDVGKPKSSNLKHSILLDGYFLLKQVLETEPPNGFGVAESLEIDQRCNEVLARCEYTGMPVSLDVLNAIYNQAREELQDRILKLCRDLEIPVEQRLNFNEAGIPYQEIIVPPKTLALLNNPKSLVERVNYKLSAIDKKLTDAQSGSLKSLLKQLKVTKEQAESEPSFEDQSEEEELDHSYFIEDICASSELIDNLLKYKSLVKLVSIDYREIINVVTGCVHPEFLCIGASTGRMASRGLFNAQQISTLSIIIRVLKNPFVSNSLIY